MLKDSDWGCGYGRETYMEGLPVGVKIYITNSLGLKDYEIGAMCVRRGEEIFNELQKHHYLHSEKYIEQGKLEKEGILKLFEGRSIFVEEIPNEYGSNRDPYYANKPWFIVTTPIGHIKIGWRKRVINIDWSRTIVKKPGPDLFPNEDVTMGDDYIHAWGYDKAKEYIDVLHNSRT